jgi:hypothetical protein
MRRFPACFTSLSAPASPFFPFSPPTPSADEASIRQEKFIRDLKNALIRIENKTYGLCKVTGKLINKERLKIVPHATMSIEAKNLQR